MAWMDPGEIQTQSYTVPGLHYSAIKPRPFSPHFTVGSPKAFCRPAKWRKITAVLELSCREPGNGLDGSWWHLDTITYCTRATLFRNKAAPIQPPFYSRLSQSFLSPSQMAQNYGCFRTKLPGTREWPGWILVASRHNHLLYQGYIIPQ